MVANTACTTEASGHVRPFVLHRDIADLAYLIETAFGPELTLTGSHMVDEMRQIALWGPALHIVQWLTPLFNGYVWIENDRVVGNVSLSRESKGRWQISNVAVLPEMRGRGIAGELVDRALEHISRHRGRRVTLQVRVDNQIAKSIYLHRGFHTFDTVHEMTLRSNNWPVVLRRPAEHIHIPRQDQVHRLYDLVRSSIPKSAQPYRAVNAAVYRGSFFQRLRRRIGTALRAQERIDLVAAPGGAPAGLVSATVKLLSTHHELDLYVLPRHRDQVETDLLEAVFYHIQSSPRRDIRATISTAHPEAVDALEGMGFQTMRVLDQMVLQLHSNWGWRKESHGS